MSKAKGSPGFVYFARTYDADCVKVGYSVIPETRLMALQKNAPVKIELICKVPGTREQEQAIIKRFASTRRWGEWFRSSPQLSTFIYRVQRAGKVPKDIATCEMPNSIIQRRSY